MNFPAEAQQVADIPGDFQPASLGKRDDLIAQIREVVPNADFTDPQWGVFEGDGFSIEFEMGDEEICQSVMLLVRGGGSPAPLVGALLDRLKVRAVDCQTSEFFDVEAARASFGSWQKYRDQIVGGKDKKQNDI